MRSEARRRGAFGHLSGDGLEETGVEGGVTVRVGVVTGAGASRAVLETASETCTADINAEEGAGAEAVTTASGGMWWIERAWRRGRS